jgi:hypothetical protein
MENTSESVEQVPQSSEPVSQKKIKLHRKQFLLMLTAGVGVIFLFAALKINNTTPSNLEKSSLTAIPIITSLTPVPPGPETEGSTIRVAIIENKNFTPVEKVPYNVRLNTSFGIYPQYHNGDIYFVDDNKIKKYSFETKSVVDIYTITMSDDQSFDNFSMYENMLYLSFGAPGNYGDDPVTMKEINRVSGAIREIPNVETVFYGTADYLFKSKNGKDITSSFGGDGCGGQGNFYRYENGQSTLIADSGNGCVNKPRYYGFLEDREQLILANGEIYQDKTLEEINPFAFRYDVLYALDVNTGIQTPLYDLKKISGIKQILMNSEKTQLVILTDKDLRILDLTSKEITNSITLNSTLGNLQFFTSNYLYAFNSDTKALYEVNLSTKTISTIKGLEPSEYFSYRFGGESDGKIYLY